MTPVRKAELLALIKERSSRLGAETVTSTAELGDRLKRHEAFVTIVAQAVVELLVEA